MSSKCRKCMSSKCANVCHQTGANARHKSSAFAHIERFPDLYRCCCRTKRRTARNSPGLVCSLSSSGGNYRLDKQFSPLTMIDGQPPPCFQLVRCPPYHQATRPRCPITEGRVTAPHPPPPPPTPLYPLPASAHLNLSTSFCQQHLGVVKVFTVVYDYVLPPCSLRSKISLRLLRGKCDPRHMFIALFAREMFTVGYGY